MILVSSFDWLDTSKLDDIETEIMNILCNEKASQYIEKERAEVITAEIRKRINTLESFIANHSVYDVSSDDNDADDNTAARYEY